MLCERCGAEFIYMDELKEQKLDIYVKVKVKDINGKTIHRWVHAPLCPDCDKDMFRHYQAGIVEKL